VLQARRPQAPPNLSRNTSDHLLHSLSLFTIDIGPLANPPRLRFLTPCIFLFVAVLLSASSRASHYFVARYQPPLARLLSLRVLRLRGSVLAAAQKFPTHPWRSCYPFYSPSYFDHAVLRRVLLVRQRRVFMWRNWKTWTFRSFPCPAAGVQRYSCPSFALRTRHRLVLVFLVIPLFSQPTLTSRKTIFFFE